MSKVEAVKAEPFRARPNYDLGGYAAASRYPQGPDVYGKTRLINAS